jgi:hypothetical protein
MSLPLGDRLLWESWRDAKRRVVSLRHFPGK